MIADRHPLVVGQQGDIGAEQLADIGRVVDAGVEIRVVAHARRHVQDAVRGAVQQGSPLLRTLGQQRADRLAQRPARSRAQRQEGVERSPGADLAGGLRLALEQARVVERAQIEDHVPDRDAAPWRPGERAEHAQGQVLDREIRVAVGRGYPGAQAGVVGVIHRHLRASPDRSASAGADRSRCTPVAARGWRLRMPSRAGETASRT